MRRWSRATTSARSRAGEASVEELGRERRASRKVQGVEDEGEGLVDRVVGAVREAEPGLVEPARPEAHEVRDRLEALPAERPLRHRSAGPRPHRGAARASVLSRPNQRSRLPNGHDRDWRQCRQGVRAIPRCRARWVRREHRRQPNRRDGRSEVRHPDPGPSEVPTPRRRRPAHRRRRHRTHRRGPGTCRSAGARTPPGPSSWPPSLSRAWSWRICAQSANRSPLLVAHPPPRWGGPR